MTGRYFSGDKESFRFDYAFKLQKLEIHNSITFLDTYASYIFSLIKKICQV